MADIDVVARGARKHIHVKPPGRRAAGVQKGQPCDAVHMRCITYQDACMGCDLASHSELAEREREQTFLSNPDCPVASL